VWGVISGLKPCGDWSCESVGVNGNLFKKLTNIWEAFLYIQRKILWRWARMTIGERIKIIRKGEGLNQIEFANRISVSQGRLK
jgi:hypothetical protein